VDKFAAPRRLGSQAEQRPGRLRLLPVWNAGSGLAPAPGRSRCSAGPVPEQQPGTDAGFRKARRVQRSGAAAENRCSSSKASQGR